MDIEFKEISEDSIDDIACLLKSHYSSQSLNYFIAHFDWVFSNKNNKVIGAYDKDRLIAIRPALSWNLRFGPDILNAYQFGGTIVHHEYRRRGLFSKLNEFFLNSTAENMEFIFNVSVYAARKGYEKLGWKYLKGFHRLTKVLPLNYLREQTTTNNKQTSIPKDELIRCLKARRELFCEVIYSDYKMDFFNWRLRNKKNEYYFLHTDNAGIGIYKLNIFKGHKEIVIGEIFLRKYTYGNFKLVIDKILKVERPFLSTVYISKSHPLYGYYLRSFYLPNPFKYNLHLGVRVLDNHQNEIIYRPHSWALSSLDLDTF